MKEIWKPAVGWEKLYEVSNLGRVYSKRKKQILKTNTFKNGYTRVTLHNNHKKKNVRVHRLVALTFLEKTNETFVVNHIDENKQNNCVSNLEWCSQHDNMKHSYRTGLRKTVVVNQYDKNGVFIKQWCSITVASECLNINSDAIINCCKNRSKSSGGYIWRYAEK